MAGHPGYWRETDGSAVAAHEAEAVWADHALDVLRDVASRFGDQIDYAELSQQVQERSGVHTRVQVLTWIGGVLRRVMQATRASGEPSLSVLVIPKRGDASAEAAWTTARMQCYRRYCADLPQDSPVLGVERSSAGTGVTGAAGTRAAGGAGGTRRPAPSTRRAGSRSGASTTRKSPTRPAARQDAPPALCPRCFLALPATGVCDNCA